MANSGFGCVVAFAHKIVLIGGAGYIGSYIYKCLKADGLDVDVCDIGLRGNGGLPIKFAADYASLTEDTLSSYSVVVWFAGHSSVPLALNDPSGALMNNCINLAALRRRAPGAARLIYASTGSLYSTPISSHKDAVELSTEDDDIYPKNNAYDMSKFCFDYMAQGFMKNFVGLRLGTVSGHSPNLRSELIFNAMNLSALRTGKVKVSNANASRSILFLDDLYRVVLASIEHKDIPDGFYNVASATGTVGMFADAVARFHGAEIERLPDSPTYSFALNTEKVQRTIGVSFNGDLQARCAEFLEGIEKEDGRQH